MLSLTQEQKMLVQTTRRLAENEFTEKAFQWQGDTPWENIETLVEHGLIGVNFEEAYGGAGMTEFEAILLIETIGRVCPDTAYNLYGMHMNAPRAISEFGTDAAKEEYLSPMLRGESQISIAISEPEAGSDVGNMTTTATPDGDIVRVDGEKTWISKVPDSDAAVVWAKFPDGIGSLILDYDADGVEIDSHSTNMSGRTQTHFYLNDVEIPKYKVLVRGREAFIRQLKMLNWERLGIATMANAMACCAFDKALDYTQQRVQFDQPIADFQGVEWMLADMAKEIEASRSLTYRAAQDAVERDRTPDRLNSSLAKLFAAEMVEEVTSDALQLHGANGYQQGHPLEYLYRMGRRWRIGGGTDEIMKNSIASVVKEDGLSTLG